MTHRPPPTHRTLIKIVAGRRAREWAAVGLMLGGLVLALLAIGALQVALCKRHDTLQAAVQCLAPLWRRR